MSLAALPAHSQIMRELMATYTEYGIELDKRHLTILADTMTYKGTVLGITRFGAARVLVDSCLGFGPQLAFLCCFPLFGRAGIEKMKDSVLGNASFEKTPDHLFAAAVRACVVGRSLSTGLECKPTGVVFPCLQRHSRTDDVNGVSACIIMGSPMELGTGCFKLMRAPGPVRQPEKRKLLIK